MSVIRFSPKHKKRLAILFIILLGIGITVTLALTAFSENMLYFFSPTQILAGEAPKNRVIRVGGLVKDGSVKRATDSLKINFDITDHANNIVPAQYVGILPDLFREGQGVIAIGRMQPDGVFLADEV
ncbi:MAG: cytochrome c maturation protein CcmE, partial [Candidatus Marithrix sp.]|nr:cytochrome c maturation protein CcmE [Candidatus Marithrix sp.]